MMTKGTICTGLLVLSIIFKFWLIAEMEITDDPDDPPNYVAQILMGGPNFFTPGTGCAGNLFRALGIPFRDGIEIAYLLTCALMVRALFDWPTKSYLALGLFLFTSFNPVPEEMFSHIMSDQVWMVEFLLGISLFVLFASGNSRLRWVYLVLATICLSFSTITRTTIIPLMAGFLVWAVLACLLSWLKRGRGIFDAKILAGGAACLAFFYLFNYSVCCYNSAYYGYFGLSLPDSQEYRDFYMCLQSVGEPTGVKYYPVDDDRLTLVARAGPVSHWFVERMRTDQNFRKIGQSTFGKYDFALPWFHFIVFFNAVPNGNLSQGFAMFRLVENEIEKAGEENRLTVRPIIPLPDCRVSILLSAVPDALREMSSLITFVPEQYAWSWGSYEPKFDNADFTQALTRGEVSRDPLREKIGKGLCVFYQVIYARMLLAFELALAANLVAILWTWRKISAFNSGFLAQQIFLVYFVVFFFWYVLFNASGIPGSPRLMIFQNVTLPLLLFYYFGQTWRMISDS